MEKVGKLWKEAENWREIQRDLPAVIKLSNMPVNELCRKAGISTTHYHHILKDAQRIKTKHLVSLFRVIVESDNFNRLKNESNG
jgi:predicted transcriptional regulator